MSAGKQPQLIQNAIFTSLSYLFCNINNELTVEALRNVQNKISITGCCNKKSLKSWKIICVQWKWV